MKQEFHETVRLPGDRGDVWAAISHIPTVLGWLSIVGEVRPDGPERYRAVLTDRLGPFRLKADIDITVEERVEGERIRARADGEDRQIGSRLIVDVAMTLQEGADGTAVDVRGAYEVTGRPAALGAGSIRKKAGRVLAEFFQSAEGALGGIRS
jgi:carbon monoxide dehydrogenase subunit G